MAASSAIIHGPDDRHEVYDEPDERLRRIAHAFSVAVIPSDALVQDEQGFRIVANRASDELGLCPQERFADQPVAALCSGVLIEPDLVLTAGHCLSTVACDRLRVVRGFELEAPGVLAPIARGDVASCAEILARGVISEQDDSQRDYAFIRLAQRIGTESAPLSAAGDPPLTAAERIVLVGNGEGLPTKLDTRGEVVDARADEQDYFLAELDNFAGGSGAGVFRPDGRLLGIAVRGASDYVWTDAGCALAKRADADTILEEVTYLQAAIAGLCAAGERRAICPALLQQPASCSIAMARSSSVRLGAAGLSRFAGLAWLCARGRRALWRVRTARRRRDERRGRH